MDKIKSFLENLTNSIISELIILSFPFIFSLVMFLLKKSFYFSLFIVLFLISIFLFICFNIKKVKVRRVVASREDTMSSNCKLIDKSKSAKIYSTRITLWPITESSPSRITFRSILTKKIESGVEIKRLWHIKNREDFKRMLYYLNKYKPYENYSLKCYIDNDFFMEEILICSNHVVSISLPQINNPRMICVCYHYFSKKDIQIWTDYFNILWEKSIPIFVNGVIMKEKIKELNKHFT